MYRAVSEPFRRSGLAEGRAAGGDRRRRFRRSRRRPRASPRVGAGDADRSPQLPPVPAAALPGGDGHPVALRHRHADPGDPARPGQLPGDHGTGDGGRHRSQGGRPRRASEFPTTTWFSPPAPATATSARTNGSPTRRASRRSTTPPPCAAASSRPSSGPRPRTIPNSAGAFSPSSSSAAAPPGSSSPAPSPNSPATACRRSSARSTRRRRGWCSSSRRRACCR